MVLSGAPMTAVVANRPTDGRSAGEDGVQAGSCTYAEQLLQLVRTLVEQTSQSKLSANPLRQRSAPGSGSVVCEHAVLRVSSLASLQARHLACLSRPTAHPGYGRLHRGRSTVTVRTHAA